MTIALRQLGLAQDVVKVECGDVASGCPIGAPGAVLTTRLLSAMKRDDVQAQRGEDGTGGTRVSPDARDDSPDWQNST
ncbi:hypothetical protein FXB40_03225 [Bradyrhizobium rifense]|uniref:Uncharacterized protein n=1 Tax=Bradyrhizobium rifense TaxID=515499 RepID=A0A5D3L098_9BRAD|nr:hypothetical protein FXB40_03225 [Bradyrhizobium rifense]